MTQTLNGNSYVALAVCALTKYTEAAGKIKLTNQMEIHLDIPSRFKPTETPPSAKFFEKVRGGFSYKNS